MMMMMMMMLIVTQVYKTVLISHWLAISQGGCPLSDGIPPFHYTKSSSARDNLEDEVLQQEL